MYNISGINIGWSSSQSSSSYSHSDSDSSDAELLDNNTFSAGEIDSVSWFFELIFLNSSAFNKSSWWILAISSEFFATMSSALISWTSLLFWDFPRYGSRSKVDCIFSLISALVFLDVSYSLSVVFLIWSSWKRSVKSEWAKNGKIVQRIVPMCLHYEHVCFQKWPF